jgi:hypothetical protein
MGSASMAASHWNAGFASARRKKGLQVIRVNPEPVATGSAGLSDIGNDTASLETAGNRRPLAG